MTQHEWDSGTPYCTRCGIQKGWHAEECLATANCVGFMHHLARRRWEREGKMMQHYIPPGPMAELAKDVMRIITNEEGKIIVEAFPREPA